jgi:hypothetical protein
MPQKKPHQMAVRPPNPSPTLSGALQDGVTSDRESKEMRGPNQSLWTMARYWLAPCNASDVITVLRYIVLHTGTC